MPFFDIFASPRWSPLRMRTKWCHFSFFPRAFKQKKIKALRPKMTKIASRGSCLKLFTKKCSFTVSIWCWEPPPPPPQWAWSTLPLSSIRHARFWQHLRTVPHCTSTGFLLACLEVFVLFTTYKQRIFQHHFFFCRGTFSIRTICPPFCVAFFVSSVWDTPAI